MPDLLLEDAIGVAGILVTLGKAIPPTEWIADLLNRGEDVINEGIL